MSSEWMERAVEEARAERDRLLESIRPTLEDVRRIEAALEALTGEAPSDFIFQPGGGSLETVKRVAEAEVERDEVERPTPEPVTEPADTIERAHAESPDGPEPEPTDEGNPYPSRAEVIESLRSRGGTATAEQVMADVAAHWGRPITRQGEAFKGLVRDGFAFREDDTFNLTMKGRDWEPRPVGKPKERKSGLNWGGPELLPEHLRLMPSADKAMSVERRIKQAEIEETILRLLEQARPDGLLGNVLASQLGDRNSKTHMSNISRRLRAMEREGYAEVLGTGFAPWQRQNKGESGGGRTSHRYGITRKGLKALGEPVDDDDLSEHSTGAIATVPSTFRRSGSPGTKFVVADGDEPRLELVRDKVTMMTEPFTAAELLISLDLEWNIRVTIARLEQLTSQGIIKPRDELRGTSYEYQRPTEPGKAAELSRRQRREASARAAGQLAGPIPGTGTNRKFSGSPMVDALLRAISRQGATWRRTGGDHFLVEYNGQRRTIAGTPNHAGLKKDKAKLRRLGLAV